MINRLPSCWLQLNYLSNHQYPITLSIGWPEFLVYVIIFVAGRLEDLSFGFFSTNVLITKEPIRGAERAKVCASRRVLCHLYRKTIIGISVFKHF